MELLPKFDDEQYYEELRNSNHASKSTEALINHLKNFCSGQLYEGMLAGNQYRSGDGVAQNDIIAYYLFRKALRINDKYNEYAFYNLGKLYEGGFGVRIDYQEAVRLYDVAASMSHLEASKRVNILRQRLHLTKEQYRELAFKAFTALSEEVLRIYDFGISNYLSYIGAMMGEPYSILRTARNFMTKRAFELDYDEARFYFRKYLIVAKEETKHFAIVGLACIYQNGMGVEQNSARAMLYLKELKKQNTELYGKYNSVQDLIDHKLNEASKNLNEKAQLYIEGIYVPYQVEIAKLLYENALSRGNMIAMQDAALMYAYGMDGEIQTEKAITILNRIRNTNIKACYRHLLGGILLFECNRRNSSTYLQPQEEQLRRLLQSAVNEGMNALQEACVYYLQCMGVREAQQLRANLLRLKKEREEKQRECPPIDGSGAEWINFVLLSKLLSEKDFDGIIEIASQAMDNENGKFAVTCYKEAAVNGDIIGLLNLANQFSRGYGVPKNLLLSRDIFARLDEAGLQLEDVDHRTIKDRIAILDARIEEYYSQSEEELASDAKNCGDYAIMLEKQHYSAEEWLIYEFYYASTHYTLESRKQKADPKVKFYSKRVNWEEVLALPWEQYIQEQFPMRTPEDDTMQQSEDISTLDEVQEELSWEECLPEMEDEESAVSIAHLKASADSLPDHLDKYFEGMIGMDSVKEQLDKIYQSVKMHLLRQKILKEKGEDIVSEDKGYNFILLGNPGTGKTTIARIIAQILYDIGIRTSDAFVEVERSKLVSDHVGGTEVRMREILDKVQGGTLFIDEAYSLYREDSSNDFGQEAIDVLMKNMEDHRNSYSVIIAGYREPMLNMIRNANSGFSSRFSYSIDLPDYSDEALIQMAHIHMQKQKFIVADGVDEAIKKCIVHDKIDQTFGNARYIRELVNRAIENQSKRLNREEKYSDEDLFTLKAVDFWNESSEEKGVNEYLEELNALTGLDSVKKEVNSLISMITVQKEMEKRGLDTAKDLGTLHMAFKGNPGTGKTTVARIIGKLYTALGVLKRDDVFVECTRADLVAEYQGQTATKVKKVVQSALGGILFIDEAYSLVQGENDTFGHEAVDMLVSEMENNRNNLVVIFAGYSQDIDQFFENNQGLRSRVPKDLYFEDYNLEELYQIAVKMLASKNLQCNESVLQELRKNLLEKTMYNSNFGNARGVRNMIDSIQRAQNVRIAKIMREQPEIVTNELLLSVSTEDLASL